MPCPIRGPGRLPSPRLSSVCHCARSLFACHTTNTWEALSVWGKDVDDAGVAALAVLDLPLCRRHPGIAGWVEVACECRHPCPRPCGADRRVFWALGLCLAHINISSLWGEGHGFLVSRPLARPVLATSGGCTFCDWHSLGASVDSISTKPVLEGGKKGQSLASRSSREPWGRGTRVWSLSLLEATLRARHLSLPHQPEGRESTTPSLLDQSSREGPQQSPTWLSPQRGPS